MTVANNPVRVVAPDAPGQPAYSDELDELYRGFESELLIPLWTQIGDLMPAQPRSRAHAHAWRWDRLLPLAQRAGDLGM